MTAGELDWKNSFVIEAGTTFDHTWEVFDKNGAPLNMLGPDFVGETACLQLRTGVDASGPPIIQLDLISEVDAGLGRDGIVLFNGFVRAVIDWKTSAAASWDFAGDAPLVDNRKGSMGLNIYNTNADRALRVWEGGFQISPDPARKDPTPAP